jgi:hypothetical protein
MANNFQITVADDVRTDEIFVELRLDNKLVLEIKPKGDKKIVALCCEGSWIETDLDSFTAALEKCIVRTEQIANPIDKNMG